MEVKNNPELNYYPIDSTPDKSEPVLATNTSVVLPTSNIVPVADSSIVNSGILQSPNFVPGVSGWGFKADGSLEAMNGTFAGTLNAPSGYLGHIILCPLCHGYISSGLTTYNSGAGFWLGHDSSDNTYKFSIEGSSGDKFTFDGVNVRHNGSRLLNQDKFGDGSDGDVTISADTSLTKDMYYNNLTINTTKILNPNGYRIFVKETLSCVGTGKIASNGNTGGTGAVGASAGAAGGTAGAIAYSTGTLPIPLIGVIGGAGGADESVGSNGLNGANQAKSLTNQNAVVGGHGGTAGTNVGGDGGSAGTKTGSILAYPGSFISSYNLYDLSSGTITQFGVSPSSGSGGGGGSAPGTSRWGGGGGGSGSSGGIVWISAKNILILNVESIGGNGGQGGNSNNDSGTYGGGVGGGGGGGNGGMIILVYQDITTLNSDVSGGIGGEIGTLGGSTDATAGTNGNDGLIIQLQS